MVWDKKNITESIKFYLANTCNFNTNVEDLKVLDFFYRGRTFPGFTEKIQPADIKEKKL